MLFDEKIRYSRNILLPQIGKGGQEKLSEAKFLVIGAGGLGSPLLLYLAATGIGTIGIIDDDKIELSNLQRQIIHTEYDIGNDKVNSAMEKLQDLNSNIKLITHKTKLHRGNIAKIIADYHIILDGTDNFETRFLVNEYCHKMGKILISGAVQGFSAIISCFKDTNQINQHTSCDSSLTNGNKGTNEATNMGENMGENMGQPCYECFMPSENKDANRLACNETGVLPSICGIAGSIMASEAVKEHLQIGQSLAGNILHIDMLRNNYKKIALKKRPNCKICSSPSPYPSTE